MPDDDPQSNIHDAATGVEVDQVPGTLSSTGDDQIGVGRGQGSDFGEDATPLVHREEAGESTPVGDDGNDSATGHGNEDHTSTQDDSALLDPSHGMVDDRSPTSAPTDNDQPQQRRRRILPTPPRHTPVSPVTRPQRERRPPAYLRDYVTTHKQAVPLPDWLRRVNWLLEQAEEGLFHGLEIELGKTIMRIIETAN